MKVPHSSQRGNAMEINMTPMIDMVFLLIVYFVWTSGDLAQELLLPSHVTEQTGSGTTTTDVPPPEADFDPVVVRIGASGSATTWTVNDEAMPSLAELETVLRRLADIKRDAPVILHPEEETPLGSVIEIYDLARVIGFEKVQFATNAR
jgi:biopolymer transport protein ExbD